MIALDAHCLLLMFDKLREDSKKKEMNFDHIVKVAIVLTTSQWKPKKRYKGVRVLTKIFLILKVIVTLFLLDFCNIIVSLWLV